VETEWRGDLTAAEYLADDRARLRAGRPVAAAGRLTDTSISVGVSVRIDPGLTETAARRGWPILRRSSGGTALLHRPGELLWSLVLPRDDPRAGRGFVRAYATLGAPVVAALADAGIAAAWGPALSLSDRFCLFGARGELLRVDGRALGGAAQHLSGAALLHHGTLNVSVDRTAIADLFGVDAGALRDRLTALEELRPTASAERIGRAALLRWASFA